MDLKQKIEEDFKKAVKEKKTLEISVLRLLKAAILNKEKEKYYKLSLKNQTSLIQTPLLSNEEVSQIVLAEIKKRKEAILEFQKGKREDLVKKEKEEIEILERYLPPQLSISELKELIKKVIEEVKAKDQKDMGKVMKELVPKVKGKADMNLVSQLVKEMLSFYGNQKLNKN